jgi:hypothetical protein
MPNKTAFEAAHTQVYQELQKAIGNGSLIAIHAYNMESVHAVQIEDFKADEASIQILINCVANGKITEAHENEAITSAHTTSRHIMLGPPSPLGIDTLADCRGRKGVKRRHPK